MNSLEKKYYSFFAVLFLALIFITIKVVLFSANHKQFKNERLENVVFVNQYLFPAYPDSSKLSNVELSDEFIAHLISILESNKTCSLESIQQYWNQKEDSTFNIKEYYLYYFAKQAMSEFEEVIYDAKAQRKEKDDITIYEAQILAPKKNVAFKFEIKKENQKIEILSSKGIDQLISRNCTRK